MCSLFACPTFTVLFRYYLRKLTRHYVLRFTHCTLFDTLYVVFKFLVFFNLKLLYLKKYNRRINRRFSSSKKSHFQTDAMRKTFPVKMTFICKRIKNIIFVSVASHLAWLRNTGTQTFLGNRHTFLTFAGQERVKYP